MLPNGQPNFDTYPEPNDFGNRKEGHPGVKEVVYDPQKVIVPPFLPDTKESRAELAQYYQAVSRLDQGVGRLVQILKEAGKYENTLLIYISDNGVAFAGAKTTLYDPGIRLPCIVRTPGKVKKGFVQPALISWTDLTPTVLDYAGALPAKPSFHGRTFRAALEGEKVTGFDQIYASHSLHEITMYYPMRAIHTPKYKLIYNIAHQLPFPLALDLVKSSTWQSVEKARMNQYGKRSVQALLYRPRFELYDLSTDPHEINNLAENPQYQTVFNDLLAKLKEFQQSTNDPWLHKWEYE